MRTFVKTSLAIISVIGIAVISFNLGTDWPGYSAKWNECHDKGGKLRHDGTRTCYKTIKTTTEIPLETANN